VPFLDFGCKYLLKASANAHSPETMCFGTFNWILFRGERLARV